MRARILAELQPLDGRPADPLLPRFSDFSRLYAFGDPPNHEPPPELADNGRAWATAARMSASSATAASRPPC